MREWIVDMFSIWNRYAITVSAAERIMIYLLAALFVWQYKNCRSVHRWLRSLLEATQHRDGLDTCVVLTAHSCNFIRLNNLCRIRVWEHLALMRSEACETTALPPTLYSSLPPSLQFFHLLGSLRSCSQSSIRNKVTNGAWAQLAKKFYTNTQCF